MTVKTNSDNAHSTPYAHIYSLMFQDQVVGIRREQERCDPCFYGGYMVGGRRQRIHK